MNEIAAELELRIRTICVRRRACRRDEGEQASLTNSRHKSGQSNYFGSGGPKGATEFVRKSLINKER
jgi:hypothetical protein